MDFFANQLSQRSISRKWIRRLALYPNKINCKRVFVKKIATKKYRRFINKLSWSSTSNICMKMVCWKDTLLSTVNNDLKKISYGFVFVQRYVPLPPVAQITELTTRRNISYIWIILDCSGIEIHSFHTLSYVMFSMIDSASFTFNFKISLYVRYRWLSIPNSGYKHSIEIIFTLTQIQSIKNWSIYHLRKTRK